MARYMKFINGFVFRDDTLADNDEVWIDSQSGQIIDPNVHCPLAENTNIIDLQGKIICPGFIDIQINGAFGFDFAGLDPNMSVIEFKQGLHATNQRLVTTGTTSYLPTMTSQFEKTYRKILPLLGPTGTSRDAALGAESLGAHTEGPFFAHTKKGCHSPEAILSLGNTSPPKLLKQVYGEENLFSYVKMVTLAPEREGALDSIRELSQNGIVASIGHTAATYQEAVAGIMAGSKVITHLYNAMNSMHHREPGLFGLVACPRDKVFKDRPDMSDDGRPYYGLIADGLHVHPAAIRLAWETHPRGLILITDAVMLMGCEDGVHQWTNGQRIVKRGSLLQLEGLETIAGSVTPILDCINNFLCWTGASVHASLQTVTTHPAALLEMSDHKGTLSPGADADIVILRQTATENGSAKLEIEQVWKFGTKVFEL